MTNIDKVGSAGFDPSVTFTDPLSRLANRTLEDVPPAADGKTVPPSDLPTLEAPAHALSIERLVAAIGNEMRRQGVREGLDAIDSQAQEIDQKYSEKLAEIAKGIDKKENQSIWDKICKVFRCIGMALGFIASIATIAAGSAMGNPALIVAGVAALLLTIDSVVSEATGGKVSLSAGFTELGKVFGLSDNTAKWFGFGMNMALTVAAVAISFGGAAASSAASAVRGATDLGAKLLNITSKASVVTNIGQGVVGVGTGVSNAVLASINYDIEQIKARKVDIEAILERMRADMETSEEFVEHELEVANDLMEKVTEISQNCAQTTAAVLTNAPATA